MYINGRTSMALPSLKSDKHRGRCVGTSCLWFDVICTRTHMLMEKRQHKGSPQCARMERNESPSLPHTNNCFRLCHPLTVPISPNRSAEATLLSNNVAWPCYPRAPRCYPRSPPNIHHDLLDGSITTFSISSVARTVFFFHYSEACQRLCLTLSQ